MGIASLILGIISIILGFIPVAGVIMIIPAIVGLILGIISIVKSTKKGISITGVILNSLAIIIIIIFSFAIVMFASDKKEDIKEEISVTEETEPGIIKKSFGTYTILDGWKESKPLSNDKKFFYIKDGTNLSKPTTNISVEVGTNKYSKENHMEFRDAIRGQLMIQMTTAEEAEGLEANGTNTENGDIMYVFTIKEEQTTTTQYYIVGDYKYMLVHVTDFKDANILDVTDAAMSIVNSFKWKY